MSLVPIEDLGGAGILKDVPPYSIPQNAWSQGSNVTFTDQGVQNIDGYFEVMKSCPIDVKHLVCYHREDMADLWLAFGSVGNTIVGSIHCFGPTPDNEDGEPQLPGWVDVTPSGGLKNYATTTWSTTFLGSQLIAASGDNEMVWWPLDDDSIAQKETLFEPLPMELSTDISNWENERGGPQPETVNAFKSILIGMNWPSDPTRVWWSSPGGHYTLPTWDYYNKNMDAGDYELNDSRGAIIDGAPLGEAFVIYKEDSIYLASYVGRPFIFAFKALTMDVGLLTKNALQEFPGGHIFMSNYDVHMTNGQTVQPLLTNKLQGELFNDLSGSNYHNAFISADHSKNTAFICWPSANSIFCDRCITWNWLTGVMSLRELPDIACMEEGIVIMPVGDSWNAQELLTPPNTWDTIGRAWGSRAFESVHPELVSSSPVTSKIYRNGGDVHTLDGDPMQSYVERTGIDLGDPGSVKKINAVWPKISTTGDTSVDVYVCGQMSPDDSIHWNGPYPFNPNHQSKVSCRVTGKYVGWRIQSTGFTGWRCNGVEFNVEPAGNRGGRIL